MKQIAFVEIESDPKYRILERDGEVLLERFDSVGESANDNWITLWSGSSEKMAIGYLAEFLSDEVA